MFCCTYVEDWEERKDDHYFNLIDSHSNMILIQIAIYDYSLFSGLYWIEPHLPYGCMDSSFKFLWAQCSQKIRIYYFDRVSSA